MTDEQNRQRAYDEARRMLWAEYSKCKRLGPSHAENADRAKQLAEVFDVSVLVARNG